MSDRRHDARFAPLPGAQATLRPGYTVTLVDVSAGGALVQAPRPLRPGARVHLQVLAAERRYVIAAQVLRCMVWSLDPADGVIYRGALKFEQRIEWVWERPDGHRLPGNLGPALARDGHQLPVSGGSAAADRARGRK